MLVIGLLPNDSDADIALNNLAEADFASRQISVLTSDPLRTAALTDTPGDWGQLTPAAAVERMRTLGVADADRQTVTTGLSNGGVLIVIRAANASTTAAQEMLADQKATLVRAVKERRGQ
ncbi:MAG TPA: hypothetical protein VKV26_18315 [Dehalococcoidia bacterium]|nr:hypothetical protein [Dehalococcoidia bacterium]